MKAAVIILNYNSSNDCKKCIGFLKRQTGIETELIVVDNCSSRDERKKVEEICKEESCTFIASNENRGYNAGNNIGLRYAAQKGYKYALIANPDMEFPQIDYLFSLISVLENDDNVAVVASDIVTPEGLHQNPIRESSYYEELFWPITIVRNRKNKKWFSCDYTKTGYCEKISGCCFMIRISFVEKIGFFDEATFLYSEEPILAKQVQNSSMKMYYTSSTQCIHHHIKSEKGDPLKRMKILDCSRRYYLSKYSGYSNLKLWMLFLSKDLEKVFLKLFY